MVDVEGGEGGMCRKRVICGRWWLCCCAVGGGVGVGCGGEMLRRGVAGEKTLCGCCGGGGGGWARGWVGERVLALVVRWELVSHFSNSSRATYACAAARVSAMHLRIGEACSQQSFGGHGDISYDNARGSKHSQP